MNKKIIFSVVLVGLLAFVAVMAFSQNNSQNNPPVCWEYKVLSKQYTFKEGDVRLFEEEANKLGAQGWELVSVQGYARITYHYFKRRLP